MIAVVFPVFETSDARSECFRNISLRQTGSQSLIQQQLVQRSILIVKRWRIVPYGRDQKMAKGAQKGQDSLLRHYSAIILTFSTHMMIRNAL